MIRLRFSTQHALGSAAIRWFTWSEWSHVDAVLPDGRWFGARADGGVQARDPYPVARSRVLDVDLPPEALDRALSQLGKPYDRTAIAGFVLRRDWQEPDSWFCSELFAWSFRPWLPLFEHHNRVAPDDLLLALQAYQAGRLSKPLRPVPA